MQCPICTSISLQQTTLEDRLIAHECAQCEGIFISSTNYWAWLETHDASAASTDNAQTIEVKDSKGEAPRAKQCPACRHLIFPYKIALDIPFTIDHCKSCNSLWLNRDKWLALRRRNLHDDLHHIVGEPWQNRLHKEEHRHNMQAHYLEKFGEQDYAEIRRIRSWLDNHPQKSMLFAYLVAKNPYED